MSPAIDRHDALLASLAIINVNWEQDRASYIDNFVPFVVDAVRHGGKTEFTDAEVRRIVEEKFALSLPHKVIGSLLGRAVKQNYLVRTAGKYAPDTTRIERAPDVSRQQAECLREQTDLVERLCGFARERFDVALTHEDAEVALLDHIEEHAVPLLATAVAGRSYVSPNRSDSHPNAPYIVAAFIVHVVEGDPSGFQYLEAMVKGYMLQSALYLPVATEVDRKFHKTTLYLDTPVALKALGHEGTDAQQAVEQMLALARNQGAKLACFTHSVNEMRGVLGGAASVIRRQNGGAAQMRGVDLHFLEIGATPSDITLAIENLERDLRRHDVDVLDKPEHVDRYTVDEQALEALLTKRVGYPRRGTLLHDLDSLTAVHRIRRGESAPRLENCRAVLLTNNFGLVRTAREFFSEDRHEWPVAMLDHDVAVLLWVKQPLAAPELPRRQLIADCYAALAPGPTLWQKYLQEIHRLADTREVTADDIALLRYSNEARRALMDTTKGDPSQLSPAALEAILEEARQAASAPAVAERDAALARAEQAEDSAEKVAETFAHQIRRLEEREQARRERVHEQAQRRATWEIRALRILAGVILLFGVLAAVPSVTGHLPLGLRIVFIVCGAVSALAFAGQAFVGGHVMDWSRAMHERRTSKHVRRITSRLLLELDE